MEQHGQRTTGREENGPLEELRLEVSDGESSVRWGWGGKVEPDRQGVLGTRDGHLKFLPRTDTPDGHMTPPQSTPHFTHSSAGQFHVWESQFHESPGTASVPPKHDLPHSARACSQRCRRPLLTLHPKCKHTQQCGGFMPPGTSSVTGGREPVGSALPTYPPASSRSTISGGFCVEVPAPPRPGGCHDASITPIYTGFSFFPVSRHPLTSSHPFLPGIPSQINPLHPNSYLGLCFQGEPN